MMGEEKGGDDMVGVSWKEVCHCSNIKKKKVWS